MKVLIIDDEKPILDMYREKLTSEGINVVTVSNGEDGLKKAESEKPDIILLDVLMPKVNGLDTLKALKNNEATKHIPVYILTNLPEESASKAHSLGGAGYPFKAETEPSKLVKFLKDLEDTTGK